MVKSETVRAITDDQKNEIVEIMAGAMPSLNFDQAQAIIGNKGPFVADISEVFRRHACLPASSTEFTIGDRTYELVPIIKEGESWISGDTMVERAKELNANLGQDDGQFILEHQAEIPQEFRGKFCMVFTDWRELSNLRGVTFLGWKVNRWCQVWNLLDNYFYGMVRLVRRRT